MTKGLRPAGGGEAFQERILAMGGMGSGKTTGWLSAAYWSHKTKSPAHFYVIDSDAAASRMLRGTKYQPLENVTVYNAFEWETIQSATEDIVPKLTPDDWAVVDFMGPCWDAVQAWYVQEIYGKANMGDYFMDIRRAKAKGTSVQELEGWKDYGVINPVYRTWMNELVHTSPAHLYLTATTAGIRETDDKGLKQIFQAFGVRPVGQKHMAFQVHTVLLFQMMKQNEWFLNSVKDRERELLVGTRVNDFTRDYLVKVAGWKLA